MVLTYNFRLFLIIDNLCEWKTEKPSTKIYCIINVVIIYNYICVLFADLFLFEKYD